MHAEAGHLLLPIIPNGQRAGMELVVQLQSKLNEKQNGSIFQSCQFLIRNVENLVTGVA